MLIPSPRHRPEDLELWREMESADMIHGQRLIASGRLEKSLDAIGAFSNAGPCYAGVSWGKDSTVLCELVGRSGCSFPVIWLTYGGATNPECFSVRDVMLNRWPKLNYREIDVGEAEDQRDDYSAAVKSANATRYISGVRGDESGIRKIVMRRWGVATDNTCRPLGWWSNTDVFGFLAVAGLPVHSNYAMLGGGRWPRKHLRTASIGGERGIEHGRAEWETEYYGDVLRRLQAKA